MGSCRSPLIGSRKPKKVTSNFFTLLAPPREETFSRREHVPIFKATAGNQTYRSNQSTKLYGEAPPQVPSPYPSFIPFLLRKRFPFSIPSIANLYPFHLPSLELSSFLTAVNAQSFKYE